MASLRERIEVVIAASPNDASKAALDVCVLLEDAIGLQGNGWFDDDEVTLAALNDER
jgi:hypothetical protein